MRTVAFQLNAFFVVEYAAAFFLLGDCPKDAINICIKHLQDYDLAVLVARIRHDRAVLLPWLIETHVLPKAQELEDKWLLHWCWWVQGEKEQAIRVIFVRMRSPIHQYRLTDIPLGFRATCTKTGPELRPERRTPRRCHHHGCSVVRSEESTRDQADLRKRGVN